MTRIVFLMMAVAAGPAAFGAQAPPPSPPAPPSRTKPAPLPAAFFDGTVLGPDGKPVAEAVIVVSASADSDPPIVARTDAEGRFRIPARRRGPHTIRVEARGLAAQRIEKAVPGASLRVTLARGGSVEGVVRDAASGQPVAGARVEAREEGLYGAPLWEPGIGIVTAETDAKGLFKLEGLARGRHSVTASSRTAGRASQPGVAAGQRVELLLVAGPSIGGRVLTPDGKPAPGAVIRAEAEMRSARVAGADANGRFEISGLTPGVHQLIAHHKDWAVAIVSGIRLERAGDVEVDVVLAAPARVSGRLVDSADERPLAGTVSLQELDGEASPHSLGLLVRAEAGPDGRFTLERVPPGSHALAAAGRGVASRRIPIDVGPQQKTLDLGDVALERGAQIRGRVRDKARAPIDAALMAYPDGPMAPGASSVEGRTEADGTFALGGTSAPAYRLHVEAAGFAPATQVVDAPSEGVEIVLEPAGTIEGLVVDDAGRPVDAFDVRAMPAGGREAMDRQPPRRRSVVSEAGRFSLDGVAAGTYVVQVGARDLGRQVVSDVKVAAGAVTDLGRIRLAAGGAVRGTVVDASSAPVAGARVVARGSDRPLMGMSDVQEAATDAGGNFQLRGLSPGTTIVAASHPDFADGRSAPVDIEPARTAETSIVLTRGGRIEGIVRRRAATPLPELRIHLRPLSPTGGFSPPSGSTPGPDGTFVIDRVPPGRVGVSLMTPSAPGSGTGTGFFKEVEVREGETARVEFTWREILLTGKVTRGGAPLPNVRLTASAMGASMMWGVSGGVPAPSAGPQRMTAVTREDGSYEMIVGDAGKITIRAQSTVGRRSYPARQIEVADVESQTVDLDFPAGGVSGIVVDAETEAPIARASVSAYVFAPAGGSSAHAVTGADGRFDLDLDPGKFPLRVSAEGYAADSMPVTVGESPVTDVRVALSRGVRLRGKVVDRQGRPAPGVQVIAREEADESMAGSAESTLDGTFELTSLRPGSYAITGRSSVGGFGLLTGISPGADDVVLRLGPTGRIRVRVKGADESPIAGAAVIVRSVNGTRVLFMGPQGRTGSDGMAEIDSPAGAIEIEAGKDKLWGRGQAAVSAGGVAPAEVRLTEGPPAP